MAVDERTFWSAAAGFDPTGLSLNDVKLRAMRQATGLAKGTINDCEHKFYADRLGVEGSGFSIADLKRRYFALIGVDLNVVRKNLHSNPSVNFDTTGWTYSFAGLTMNATRETASGTFGTTPPGSGAGTWYKVAATAGAGTGLGYIISVPNGTSAIPVTAGSTYTFSTYFGSTKALNARVGIDWYDSSGAPISTTNPTFTAVTANSWLRLNTTATAPAGAAYAHPFVAADTTGIITTGDYLGCTAWLVEAGSTLSGYFDGAVQQAPNTDLTPRWLGAANASPSVLINNTFQSALSDMQKRYITGTLKPDWSWTAA